MKFHSKISAFACITLLSCAQPSDRAEFEHPYDRWALHYLNDARPIVLAAIRQVLEWDLKGGPSVRAGLTWDEVMQRAMPGPLPLDACDNPMIWKWLVPGESILIIAIGADGQPMTGDEICVIELFPGPK